MTSKTLEQAYEAAKKLPRDRQEQLGEWVRDFVEQEQSGVQLTPEQNAEVARRMADPSPIYATDDQVKAVLAKFAIR